MGQLSKIVKYGMAMPGSIIIQFRISRLLVKSPSVFFTNIWTSFHILNFSPFLCLKIDINWKILLPDHNKHKIVKIEKLQKIWLKSVNPGWEVSLLYNLLAGAESQFKGHSFLLWRRPEKQKQCQFKVW